MYLRHTIRKKDGKVHRYWRLVVVMGVEILGGLALGPLNFRTDHRRRDCADDAGSYTVLQVKHIFMRSIKAIRPQMRPSLGIDKLTSNANAASGLADASFEHIADPKLPPNLLHVSGPVTGHLVRPK